MNSCTLRSVVENDALKLLRAERRAHNEAEEKLRKSEGRFRKLDVSDIAERKHAEDQNGNLSRRLKLVMDAATQVSIIATDAAGVITVFNAGAERMLGYSAEEMVGRQTPSIFHLEAEVAARGAELSREFGRPVQGFDVF